MSDKRFRISRAADTRPRPVMLAIAGDSAAGKATLTRGLAHTLGTDRCVVFSADDYQRFDRTERTGTALTPVHPDSNYLAILEQHLQLLATGQPVLKPVYDHTTGLRTRPELVEPNDFVIVHGVLPLHSKLARACFDVSVYLDPAEDLRRCWKLRRDTVERGYTDEQVRESLAAAESASVSVIRPQRAEADIVVRFAGIDGRDDPPGTPLSAEVLLRNTIAQPDLAQILQPTLTRTAHLRLTRDTDGRPVDSLHIHGYASAEENAAAELLIWRALGEPDAEVPICLGNTGTGTRSTPLAITQMLLRYHMMRGSR
ncbi:phosphoribulokinase [Mycobacterium frederiksbergense]|uniref:phosphoribulokinase n=2 Tax=Mycolicibacterium frederiksbergense TaxID=117567 RepID=A0A6H0S9D4_9MYCO|nr:phosphoribulokinase [Mycolicibacterium frederiksbergense]MCV7043464.1 phosphoribulokinase [Mycolicibacterium frederiksbergense]QIV83904.1 phosphoribulokinase [Mycolicibacterium frederiksbergense]